MNVINNISWTPLSNHSEIVLGKDNFADLFYIPISQQLSLLSYEYILSDAELVYCNSFIQPFHQQSKKIGKIVTRLLLSYYTHIPPKDLQIERTLYGKPYCVQAPAIHFNSSDAADTILLIISFAAVGVDIEWHQDAFAYKDIVADYFTEKEINEVNNSKDPLKAFYRVWVRKESLLKAIGTGFGSLEVNEQGWYSEVYQQDAYSFAITINAPHYALRFFKYLAIKP